MDPRIDAGYPDDSSSLAFNKKVQIAHEYKVDEISGFTRDLRFIVRQGA